MANRSEPDSHWLQARQQLQGFVESLYPYVQSNSLGRPLGEGLDLEKVSALVLQQFRDVDCVRTAGTIIAVDILGAGESIGPDLLRGVMGVPVPYDQCFTQEQVDAANALAGAAESFLGQFDEDGAPMWDLWNQRNDVAVEFLCWLTIARLRLASAGHLEAF